MYKSKSKVSLTTEESLRYQRHIVLPEIGLKGQQRLKDSKVLIIGAGGLGCPLLSYLTAAGVGTIGIVDFDKVDESNLQRQILYRVSDIGKPKAETAKKILQELNPHINYNVYDLQLTSQNALEILKPYDIVVDGSDNFPTRYLVNDACVMLDKPFVYGSIYKFEGQAAVFNYLEKSGIKGPTYRCLFPEPPSQDSVPNCAEAGVLGVLPGLIGCIQANEVIKIIIQIGEVLSGKLLVIDALTVKTSLFEIERSAKAGNITQLVDYRQLCNSQQKQKVNMKEITVKELKLKIDNKETFQLIDVREPHEYDFCNLKGELIPMNKISVSLDRIAKNIPVIVHCRSGGRSAVVVNSLEKEFGFTNLYNLKGGILAWCDEIDSSMSKY